MKNIKLKILIIFLLTIIAGELIVYYQVINKKEYDYSNYYVLAEEISQEEGEEVYELSLPLLKQTNNDIVGILEFDDQIIYEPIVQALDNSYYVRRNIDGNYAPAGIPFISSTSNINSKNVVVYGHSSKQEDIIFTPLMNYIDYEYYKLHPTFIFNSIEGIRTYRIFAVLNIDLNNLDDSLEFSLGSFRSNEDFNSFINDSINNSLYNTNIKVESDDLIMTLVTCDTRNDNKRIVVLAKLV